LVTLITKNIKNSSAFRTYDRTTGIWQDDRMTDRGS
jgi:hypothetical protein